MQLRSHGRQNFKWDYMPPELQLLVLERLLEKLAEERPSDKMPTTGLANYASVCRSWQMFFEKRTFRHFILYASEIADFDRIVGVERRKYVKHILLHATLAANIARIGSRYMTDLGQNSGSDMLFLRAVRDLWSVLSRWETTGAHGNTGLTLELGPDPYFHSADPRARECRPYYARYLENGTPPPTDLSMVSVLRQMSRDVPADWHFIGTFFRKPLDFNTSRIDLPRVDVVKNFLTRLRFFPSVSPAALASIFKSLPQLESIRLEQWRTRKCKSDSPMTGLGPEFSNLKKLSVYEDSLLKPKRYPNPLININLVKHIITTSRHLEHLSIASLIDARDILLLRTCWTPADAADQLKVLTTVALTSRILTSRSNIAINEHLLAAARAAKCMPKLRLLELWNHHGSEASIFRYQKTDQKCEISWQSTWELRFEKKVARTWREAADASSNGRRSELRIKTLWWKKARDRAAVIRRLQLKSLVLHDLTLNFA